MNILSNGLLGMNIRRTKQEVNIINHPIVKRSMTRFNAGSYNRMDFLHAVSPVVGSHVDELLMLNESNDDVQTTSSSECCVVCLTAERDKIVLVPCGHAQFCRSCIQTVTNMNSLCPVCRAVIIRTLDLYD